MRALQSVEAAGTTPALILLDLTMPVMDGVAFLAHIPDHAQLASVPVIVMSGDSRALLRAEQPDNVREVLPKPIDVSRMMELVRKHMVHSPRPRNDTIAATLSARIRGRLHILCRLEPEHNPR